MGLGFLAFFRFLAAAQAPLEATLTEEEARRNSRRLDLLYLASSHPVAPDVFQLCDAAAGDGEAARALLERPLDPQLSGARPLACAHVLVFAEDATQIPSVLQTTEQEHALARVRPAARVACAL